MRNYGVFFYLMFVLLGCKPHDQALKPKIQEMEVNRPFSLINGGRYDAAIVVSYELLPSSDNPEDWQNHWVRNLISDAYRQAFDRLTIDELVSMDRPVVSQTIKESISDKTEGLGIRFIDLNIKSITPTPTLLPRLASNYRHALTEKENTQQLLDDVISLREFISNAMACRLEPESDMPLAFDQYKKEVQALSASVGVENKRLDQFNKELELLLQTPDYPSKVSAVDEKQYIIAKYTQRRDEIRRDADRESKVLADIIRVMDFCDSSTGKQSKSTLVITEKITALQAEEKALTDQVDHYSGQMALAKRMTVDAGF